MIITNKRSNPMHHARVYGLDTAFMLGIQQKAKEEWKAKNNTAR